MMKERERKREILKVVSQSFQFILFEDNLFFSRKLHEPVSIPLKIEFLVEDVKEIFFEV